MLIVKSLVLQILWFLIVFFGKELAGSLAIVLAITFLLFDYLVFKPKMSIVRFISLALFFSLYGFLNDILLIRYEIILAESYSFNYLLLWVVFLGYYEIVFDRLRSLPLWITSLLGGTGGSLAYISASKLDAFIILPGQEYYLIAFVFLSWTIFFPLTLRVYNMKSLKNYLLDKLVFTSFDLSGFKRHQKDFDDYPDLSKLKSQVGLLDKTALVTGGTSGIGESVLTTLSSLGVTVDFIGRNEVKAKSIKGVRSKGQFIKLDMGSWKDIRNFSSEAKFYDYVVLNAGAMPKEKVLNEQGVELQCASQLIGHFMLLNRLRRNGQISSITKIVWVSSGGMYLKRLDLDNLINPSNYEKVDTYANVKRAQVTFVEELSKLKAWKDFQNYSMHPGWVGTQGLKDALPKFYSFFEKRLRGAAEGSDTIVWLLITNKKLVNGGFYFDRKKVKPYFFRSYNPSKKIRKKLTKVINRFINK